VILFGEWKTITSWQQEVRSFKAKFAHAYERLLSPIRTYLFHQLWIQEKKNPPAYGVPYLKSECNARWTTTMAFQFNADLVNVLLMVMSSGLKLEIMAGTRHV
jgi:hypothetical protein